MVLDLTNAGALIEGYKTKEDVMESWTIKVLRPFFFGGVRKEKDSVISVGRLFAIEMISSNKAVRIIEAPKSPEPASVKTETPAPAESTTTADAPQEKPESYGKGKKK
jgi:hypothetical protein